MIDQKLLRQSAEEVAENLARRGHEFDAEAYLALEEQRKLLQVDTEGLRNERNTSARKIGKAKAAGDDVEPLLAAVKDLGDRLDASEARLREVLEALQAIELGLPNLLHDDVPTGNDESKNQEVRRWGDIPAFDFDPEDHVDLGLSLGMLDFDAASRIS
ncbi:MAG: serine--tRNA ligase, partial [Woeseiaceae bacterium]|nr:serine--tRNA ligase [Woeseiaceae bacterium]